MDFLQNVFPDFYLHIDKQIVSGNNVNKLWKVSWIFYQMCSRIFSCISTNKLFLATPFKDYDLSAFRGLPSGFSYLNIYLESRPLFWNIVREVFLRKIHQWQELWNAINNYSTTAWWSSWHDSRLGCERSRVQLPVKPYAYFIFFVTTVFKTQRDT